MLATPFYDDVHQWTFRSRNAMSRTAGNVDHHLRYYRNLIRKARRFVLDDSMVSHMVHLSNTPNLDQFNYWSLLARLPFDNMWVEWDQWERLKIAAQLNKLKDPFDPSEVAQANGMLLTRDPATPSTWLMYMFCKDSSKDVFINPLVFAYNPDGHEIIAEDQLAPTPWGVLGQRPLSEEINLGRGAEYSSLGYMTSVGSNEFSAPQWSFGKVGAVVEPIWRQWRQQGLSQSYQPALEGNQSARTFLKHANEPFMEQLVENRGILRTMIAFLAMLNNVPHYTHPVLRKGYRSVGMNRVPFLGHSNVILRLPKRRQLEYIQQRMRQGYARHQRFHDVRGHYRRTVYDRSNIRCHHIPSADSTSDNIRCGRCGHSIRWVETYLKGDINLGRVDRLSYTVKAD
jgi:hypothetical protein